MRTARYCARIGAALLALAVVTAPCHAQAGNQDAARAWEAVPRAEAIDLLPVEWQQHDGLFTVFEVDLPAIGERLAQAPHEQDPPRAAPFLVDLPAPGGAVRTFEVVEYDIIGPGTQAKYSDIHTYYGWEVAARYNTIRVTTSSRGVSYSIADIDRGTVLLDPLEIDGETVHVAHFKRDHERAPFQCLTTGGAVGAGLDDQGREDVALPGAPTPVTLRIIRLAMSATGEFTEAQDGANKVEKKTKAIENIVNGVARLNQVYERDFAVRLVLADGFENVVYDTAATDPFGFTNIEAALAQNHANLNNQEGLGNLGTWDVGHLLHKINGANGLATLGSLCNAGTKGRGATFHSEVATVNDPFWIDFIAHEIGHQFNCSHTWNGSSGLGSCKTTNWSRDHAREPGSGTTIMAYAGICAEENVQTNGDDYFHVDSIVSATMHLDANPAPGCGVNLAWPPNNAPDVMWDVPNFEIPRQTPFWLLAKGSDPDSGQELTYTIEEYQTGPQQDIPMVPGDDNGKSPLFRSLPPTTEPRRFFPRIDRLLGKGLPAGQLLWAEVLPNLPSIPGRKFRATVRDNKHGTSNVEATVEIVTQTNGGAVVGPFVVTAPKAGDTPTGLTNVTWAVAGTDVPPLSTTNVRILLSVDGGESFKKLDQPPPAGPTVLAASTPNDGSASVTMPGVAHPKARIMVHGEDRIFFNISEEFSIGVEADEAGACCLPSGVCLQATQAGCASVGGTWLGLGVPCEGDSPPVKFFIDPFDGPCLKWKSNLNESVFQFESAFSDGKYVISELTPFNGATSFPVLRLRREISAPDKYSAELTMEWAEAEGTEQEQAFVSEIVIKDMNDQTMAFVGLNDTSEPNGGPSPWAHLFDHGTSLGLPLGLSGTATFRFEGEKVGEDLWKYTSFVNNEIMIDGEPIDREAAAIEIHTLASSNPDVPFVEKVAYDHFEFGGCLADCNGDGLLNILDFICFQELFEAQDPAADCNGDGLWNILDFVCFQEAFQEGCE